MRYFVPALLGLALTACAVAPENIQPAYVSELAYQPWTCEQLGQEQTRMGMALATASDAQRRARSNDTAGVILLGLPVSSLSGSNQASNIARLKGEMDAMQRAGTLKNCGLPAAPYVATAAQAALTVKQTQTCIRGGVIMSCEVDVPVEESTK